MNRAERRRTRRSALDSLAVAAAYECPDCDADTRLTQDEHGIWHLTIRHDTTCPNYRRMR